MAAPRMPLFKPVYLDRRVSLSPADFGEAAADIDRFLLNKLKKELEGQCCTHGYVKPKSAQILARSMGQVEHGRFTGDFIFHCKLKLMCLLPHADQIVDARVLKMNKLGAYALVIDEGQVREAMRILIPRDLHIGNAEFDAIIVGQSIRTKLLRSRFQVNDTFIQSVGTFEGMSTAALAPEPEPEPEPEPAAEDKIMLAGAEGEAVEVA